MSGHWYCPACKTSHYGDSCPSVARLRLALHGCLSATELATRAGYIQSPDGLAQLMPPDPIPILFPIVVSRDASSKARAERDKEKLKQLRSELKQIQARLRGVAQMEAFYRQFHHDYGPTMTTLATQKARAEDRLRWRLRVDAVPDHLLGAEAKLVIGATGRLANIGESHIYLEEIETVSGMGRASILPGVRRAVELGLLTWLEGEETQTPVLSPTERIFDDPSTWFDDDGTKVLRNS